MPYDVAPDLGCIDVVGLTAESGLVTAQHRGISRPGTQVKLGGAGQQRYYRVPGPAANHDRCLAGLNVADRLQPGYAQRGRRVWMNEA
jgi:hypothetical protein